MIYKSFTIRGTSEVELTDENIRQWRHEAKAKADELGLTEWSVYLVGTTDYDGCGEVSVELQGSRPPQGKEVEVELKNKKTQELANKLGLTFYEASVLYKLAENGKVNVDL